MTTALAPDLSQFLLHVQTQSRSPPPSPFAFDAMLEQIGPGFTPIRRQAAGAAQARTLGPAAATRDLGNNAGHLWATSKSSSSPTLLEITGPLFMSYAVSSHVQYRFTAQANKTLLTLTHRAFGENSAPSTARVCRRGWEYIAQKPHQGPRTAVSTLCPP